MGSRSPPRAGARRRHTGVQLRWASRSAPRRPSRLRPAASRLLRPGNGNRAGSLALGTDAWGRRAQLPLRARSHRLGGRVPRQKAAHRPAREQASRGPVPDRRRARSVQQLAAQEASRREARRRRSDPAPAAVPLQHAIPAAALPDCARGAQQPRQAPDATADLGPAHASRRRDHPHAGLPGSEAELPTSADSAGSRGRAHFHPSAQARYSPRLEVTPRVAGEPSIENRIGVGTWIVQCAVFTAVMLREFSEPPQEVIDRSDLWAWFASHAAASRPQVKRS